VLVIDKSVGTNDRPCQQLLASQVVQAAMHCFTGFVFRAAGAQSAPTGAAGRCN
jgi:hypothetical protein